jgi:hypothetical protein
MKTDKTPAISGKYLSQKFQPTARRAHKLHDSPELFHFPPLPWIRATAQFPQHDFQNIDENRRSFVEEFFARS